MVKEPVFRDRVPHAMKPVVLTESLLNQIEPSKLDSLEDLKINEDVVLPEIANPLEVTVYPNPSASRVFVRTNNNDTYQYGVIDLNGKLVFQEQKKEKLLN